MKNVPIIRPKRKTFSWLINSISQGETSYSESYWAPYEFVNASLAFFLFLFVFGQIIVKFFIENLKMFLYLVQTLFVFMFQYINTTETLISSICGGCILLFYFFHRWNIYRFDSRNNLNNDVATFEDKCYSTCSICDTDLHVCKYMQLASLQLIYLLYF